MREYLTELVAAKDREPGEDLLSRLVVKHMRTGELSLDQVVSHARLLLAGGHDTTAGVIGLGMLALLLDPDQRYRLANDRALMRNAVEEMLRFNSITHIGRRRAATSDISIGEVTIKAGEEVIADTSVGNRDPRVFNDPDSFVGGHEKLPTGGHESAHSRSITTAHRRTRKCPQADTNLPRPV
jgi:cytochrome P450